MSAPDQLAPLLGREVDCLARLCATLEQEYKALTDADIDALEKITLAKNATMAEQAELAVQRSRLVVAAGFEDSNNGLAQCIAHHPDAASLNEQLETLADLAQQCQQHNRENGRIIVQKQQQTQSALNILRQSDASGPTYSVQGTTAATEDSRSLGKA